MIGGGALLAFATLTGGSSFLAGPAAALGLGGLGLGGLGLGGAAMVMQQSQACSTSTTCSEAMCCTAVSGQCCMLSFGLSGPTCPPRC